MGQKNLNKLNRILGKDYFKNKIKFSLMPSLEAQIASISDDIAYNSHDLEDGLKSNLFKLEDLEHIPVLRNVIAKYKKIKNFSMDLIIRQIIREIINEMVKDIITTTKKNIKNYEVKNLNDVYNCKKSLVSFSKKMREFDKKIKIFLKKKCIFIKMLKKY